MKKTALHVRLVQLLWCGCLTAGSFAAPLWAAQNDAALKMLFDQADYWHQRAHDDLAKDALQKVLLVDANNTQALYLLALYAQHSGDNAGAARWRQRLMRVSPNDPRLSELENARKVQSIPPSQLNLARAQARSGNTQAALQTWRAIFNGNSPPSALAAEYYLTMAGDQAMLPQAIAGLRQVVAQQPQDNGARLALAKALTYQETTRREGMQLLQNMSDSDKGADRALRQALLWLAPQPDDGPFYQRWLQRHPQDGAVMAYFRNNVGGATKGQGFTALNRGDVSGAQTAFQQVLQVNPNDADALAGMGYAAQRRGDYATAADYLERAAAQNSARGPSRAVQAEDTRFYAALARAQQMLQSGNTAQAQTLSEPLAQMPGEKGVAAKLFLADVLRRAKQPARAEQTLREVLQSDPNNTAAKEALFYVLRQQNRTAEANTLLAALPARVRKSVAPKPGRGGVGNSVSLRQRAQQALANGDTQQAITLLQQGIRRSPHDAWMRLDLARIYRQMGDRVTAANVIQPLFRRDASRDERFAGAINASETGAWQQASLLLSRIPASQQTADMRALAQRANFNLQMATAERYLAQGATTAAANTLRALAVNPPQNPLDAGKLAQKLAQAGDLTAAVGVVRNNMRRGIQGNAGDYAAQVAVLNQAGLSEEALAFLNNPALQARSSAGQLAGVRAGSVVNEADQLRERKQYAAAYDKLIGALQRDPQNTALMLAMARLYQSGKMYKEAGVVYNYLLARDTPDQQAREGAINVALATRDVKKAQRLSAGLRNTQTPARLLLLARISQAAGRPTQALSYLRRARGSAAGLHGTQIGGLLLADNPFTDRTSAPVLSRRSASVYGQTMPWQQSLGSGNGGDVVALTDKPVLSPQAQTMKQIDTLINELENQTASWVEAGAQVRGRDGEEGLSKLIEAKAPLSFSVVPAEQARFTMTVTPVSLDPGSVDSQAGRRFGTGALVQATSAAVQTLRNEGVLRPDGGNYTFDDLNLLTANGQANVSRVQNSLVSASAANRVNSDEIGVGSSGSQKTSGVELSAGLSGDSYKVDLGSTPLSQDLTTLVGGIQWTPKLTDYLSLILTGERRVITDSLLSYVGAKDSLTGKRWGQVTKNGGNAMVSYDDGDAGFYAGAGAYSYVGQDVARNHNVTATAGVYVRPFHDDISELKTGINISWMDFSKNLNFYSYGQGGYFSPQDYISVSLPVDYAQKYDDLAVRLGGSVGYQSYTQARSAYFPNHPQWQRQLENAVAAGLAREAYYEGNNEDGIGFNVRAGADYKVNKDVTIGGQLSYDTFGDYNESTAHLYFRYLFGEK